MGTQARSALPTLRCIHSSRQLPFARRFMSLFATLQVEESSYREIALALGQDSPADILFATDNVAEVSHVSGHGNKFAAD